jgi:hypothetical protein
MLLANNLTVLVCSFVAFVLVYNLDPSFDGSLGVVSNQPSYPAAGPDFKKS